MSISINATLAAGLAAGTGSPIIKVEYLQGAATYITTSNVFKYVIDNMDAEAVIENLAIGVPIYKFRIIRGLNINGVDYTVTSSWFRTQTTVIDRTRTRLKGTAFTNKRISTAGDISADTLLSNVFTAAADSLISYNLSLPSDFSEWWRGVQFLPTGKIVLLQKTEYINNYLRQKYLAQICNLGQYSDTVNKVTVIGANYRYGNETYDHTLDASKFPVLEFDNGSESKARYYTWLDEAETRHFIGVSTSPMHNLGFIPSTASPAPADWNGNTNSKIRISMPNLAITPGDMIQITNYTNFTALYLVSVREVFDINQQPSWYQDIGEIPFIANTAGGGMPDTIERVANYTPLNTTNFDSILSANENNVQSAFDKLDDHTHNIQVPTAANDFLLGAQVSGVWTWVKNTLAQAVTALRTVLDGVYSQLGHTHTADWVLIEAKNMDSGDAASFDFQNIPATYSALKIILVARSDRAANTSDAAKIKFNNDGGNNYVGLIQWAGGSTPQVTAGAPTACTFVTAATSPASWFNHTEILIPQYANANIFKSWQARGMQTPTNSGSFFIYDAQGLWLSATAISRVTLYPNLGTNFKQYSTAILLGMR